MKNILLCSVITMFLSVYGSTANENPLPSITNAGGWAITLTAPTNHIILGQKIVVSLMVSNTTSQVGDFNGYTSDWASGLVTPNFGRLLMTNLDTSLPVSRAARKQSGFVAGRDMGGGINPYDWTTCDLDAGMLFDVKITGTYEVRFEGRLNSILEKTKVEFETPPLVLRIEAPKPGTNAPPDVPKK